MYSLEIGYVPTGTEVDDICLASGLFMNQYGRIDFPNNQWQVLELGGMSVPSPFPVSGVFLPIQETPVVGQLYQSEIGEVIGPCEFTLVTESLSLKTPSLHTYGNRTPLMIDHRFSVWAIPGEAVPPLPAELQRPNFTARVRRVYSQEELATLQKLGVTPIEYEVRMY
jgi:hypothetical protein